MTHSLGSVSAPSGVLVLAMAGALGCWAGTERPLSVRGLDAAGAGGGHLHLPEDGAPADWYCEAVAVPAAPDRLLPVRAETALSPFDGGPTVSLLEVDLGIPWPDERGPGPVHLGELPVDRCGMLLGDARALDGFVGLGGDSVDGLADVTYWGRYQDDAHAAFGGEPTPFGSYGHLDLPLAEAEALAARLAAWVEQGPGKGLVMSLDPHSHYHLLHRAGWDRPLLDAVLDIDGCPVLSLDWDQGDHSVRHNGERAAGQVYPAALAARDGSTILRWTIPPYDEKESQL
ncbi:hypothetical protein AB0M38_29010 [Streptomyces sp. NPDC051742]|uniref:hypothetical protein n=1 Tax=unclassified Streptomyces TaxID=2593676 RepID=UPI003412F221